MIQLGEEQLNTLEKVKHFLKSDETCYSIVGAAGSGKSLLIKYLIEYLESVKIKYVLCAPTHKAKVVLERFTERPGITLHKLLSLSPNIEILDLDFKDLRFYTNKSNLSEFPNKGVVICDESSMVSDDLCDLLEEKCRNFNSKVIFVGDKAQLRPVKSDKSSKVFELENKSILTKIYRQSEESGLLDVLTTLRTDIIPKFENVESKDGSLHCYDNAKDFLLKAIPYFNKAKSTSDILEVKILAYTNARVDAFNTKMKEVLFKDGKEYNKFEFITGCENIEFNNFKFWNSMDYIVVDEPVKKDVHIHNFMKLPGWNLNLYDSSDKKTSEIFILSKEIPQDYYNSLAAHIEGTRLNAIELKQRRNRNSGKAWADYYQIVGGFTSPVDLMYDNRVVRKKTFTGGYATTCHKSQGSSIQNVFVDMKNVMLCRNQDELRQLQYVGLSRTRNNVYLLQ